MKLWKISMILIGVLVLILSSITVSAETQTDETGDVYHWKMVDSTWSWQPSTDPKSYIDITELTYTSSEDKLILSLEVSGNIQSSENIAYMAWVNTSDATYQLYWMNNQSFGIAISTEEGGTQFDMNPNVTVSGGTITCTFNLVGTEDTSTDFWGYAMEYTELGDTNQEWWGDWIPGTYAPFWGENGDEGDDGNGDSDVNGNGGGSDTNGGGTPGFEAVALISALALVIIILRRRE